jgi:putative heme-binding domain-containing protein
VNVKSQKGLTAALASPNLAVRSMAIGQLQSLGLPKALEALEPAVVQKYNPVLRARALWQLGKLGNLRFVTSAFHDPDPRFRILAMRILNDFRNHSPADYIPDWKADLVKDPSAAVRREALLLLREADPGKAAALILDLAATYDGKDRFFLAAVGIAVGQDKSRREVLLADFPKRFAGWNEKIAGLVWELRPPQVLPHLGKQLADAKVPDPQRRQIVDVLAQSDDPAAAEVLLKALHADAAREVRDAIVANLVLYLPGKWSRLRQSKELSQTIKELLDRVDTRLAGLALIAAAGQADFLDQLISITRNGKENMAVRLAAVKALGVFKNNSATGVLVQDLLPAKEAEIAVEAARALASQGTPEALRALQEIAGSARAGLALRQTAVAGLSGSRPGTTWLLQAHAEKKLAKDLIPDLARLLRHSPFQDLRNKALVAFPPPPKLDPKSLPSIPALLARKGNPDRGKQVMLATLKNEAQCLKCHTINGVGGNVGPDLSVIGSKASRENLLESILYPSRAIADQYLMWIVETKNGLNVQGLIVEDTADHIILRDATAKDYKIAKRDIETRTKSQVSIMPDNLIQHLREEDLVDLVEYMYGLKSPPLTPVGLK